MRVSESSTSLFSSSLLSPASIIKKRLSHVGRLEGPVEGLDDLLLVRDLVDVFRAAVFLFSVEVEVDE